MTDQNLSSDHVLQKENVLASVGSNRQGVIKRYRNFFVGDTSFSHFLLFEFASWLAAPLPGALGYAMRKFLYPKLGFKIDRSVLWGRNVTLRHRSKISVGDGTALDDSCVLDARGADQEGFKLGSNVLIARESVLQAKYGPLHVGDGCSIGPKCYLGSAGGIFIGNRVSIGGCSYIGGGRYVPDAPESASEQEIYSKGPVVIEDEVYLGANVCILDGVTIGRGAFIGAGAVVQNDVGPDVILAPYQKQVSLPRRRAGDTEV